MKSIKILIALLFLSPLSAMAGEFPDDLSKVEWHGNNVSKWPITSKLNTRVSGGTITLDYDKKNRWPGKSVSGCICNANPWIFVKIGSKWHGTTFEYFRTGQTSKNWKKVLDGGRTNHMKGAELQGWLPKNGQIYGFMVAGISRFPGQSTNIKERTQVQLYEWGVGPVKPKPKPQPAPPPPPVINQIINTLLD